MRLPKDTPELAAAREEAVALACQEAATVPLNLMKSIGKLWQPLRELAKVGNLATKSDMQVECTIT